MAIDETNPGGLGGLGGFFGEGGGGTPFLQALGLALMSSPRNAPLQNLPQILPGLMAQSRKDQESMQERQAIELLLTQSGFSPDEAKRLARNPAIAKMAIDQKQTERANTMFGTVMKNRPPLPGEVSAPSDNSPMPSAPARPAPLSAYNEANPEAGGEGRPSMIGQPMPTLRAAASVGDDNRDLLIRTVIGEAAREPEEGQAAVAHTVLNRVNSGRFGDDVPSVLFAPKQFEPWNTRRQELMAISPDSPVYKRAAQIVDGVLAGNIPDPTNGATHFQNPDVVRQRGNASGMRWFNDMVNNGSAVRIGQHVFGSPDGQPGSRGVQVASLRDQPVNLDGLPPGPVASDFSSLRGTPAAQISHTYPNYTPSRIDASSLQNVESFPSAPSRPSPSFSEGLESLRGTEFARTTMAGPQSSGEASSEQPRLAQVAQASGAMPSGQPSIRNVVPPTMMPSLNAFAPEGASEWRGETAQLPPQTVNTAVRSVSTNPPPAPDQVQGERSKRAAAIANVQYWTNAMIVAGQLGDKGKGIIEAAKFNLDVAKEYLKPTEIERTIDAMGIPEGHPMRREIIERSLADNRPTSVKETRYLLQYPDHKDLLLETKRAGANNVINEAQKLESEDAKNRAKSASEFLSDIAKSAPKVAGRNADLDILGRLVSRTETGPVAGLRAELDRIGKYLGMTDGSLATKADAINALTQRIAPTLREVGSGSQSDTELRGFLASLPQLSATPDGNALILSSLRRAAQIDRQRTSIASQWQAGKMSTNDARAKIAEIDEMSIFAGDKERELFDKLVGDNVVTSRGFKIIGVD